jgi:hypothetical protein
MSWRDLSITDVIRVMQAVADVAPDKASKLGFVLAKGNGQRRRAKRDGEGYEFVNPGPTVDEAAVLAEVFDAVRKRLVARWGEDYTVDLQRRLMKPHPANKAAG